MNPEKYKEAVLKAKEAMEGVELDAELKKIAFSEIIRDLLSGNQYRTSINDSQIIENNDEIHNGDPIGTISKHLNIERESVNMVFSFDGDKPSLALPSDRLPRAKKKGAQEIALLVCAAYEALGRTEIETDLVRDECKHYDRYDGANFMKVLNVMSSFINVKGKPNSKKKTLILKLPGREEAVRIIQRMAGGDA